MGKNRLEAFSDGVIAILITIMVLELKVPHGGDLSSLRPLLPVISGYVLSFVFVGIYWNNHHHLLHTVHKISGGILWANLHLLFWLSLIPFTTSWTGEHPLTPIPTALYGVNLLLCGMAYWILQKTIIHTHGEHSVLKHAVGGDFKGNISPVIYLVAVVLAFYWPLISTLLYVLVALMWLIPDRRIERALQHSESGHQP
jgi:uncharacterized membrane protein